MSILTLHCSLVFLGGFGCVGGFCCLGDVVLLVCFVLAVVVTSVVCVTDLLFGFGYCCLGLVAAPFGVMDLLGLCFVVALVVFVDCGCWLF